MGGISNDNCLLYVDHKMTSREYTTIEAAFETYDFRLEFDGLAKDFVDGFETRFKEFTKHVLKSYREYRYRDEYYAGCLESMIGGFKLQECPYKRVVRATNTDRHILMESILFRR